MRRFAVTLISFVIIALAPAWGVQSTSPFDTSFTSDTMRVDYFHSGGHGTEMVALDRVLNDGTWPGNRTRLVDDTNLGKYLFEVIDRDTNQVIYSRGFASIFGEWETTSEAKDGNGTFHESLRFPWPKRPVQVVLKKRDRLNAFHEFWSTLVDPDSRLVNKARLAPMGKVVTLWESGPASTKVDLLLLGDGYTDAEMPKFVADARRLTEAMFAVEPYKSRRSDFNVRALAVATTESGIHNPRTGMARRTPLGTSYNIFDSER